MNIFAKLRLEREWHSIKYQMELFAIENNVGNRKKFINEIKTMYFFRDEITRMTYALNMMNSTNAAVPTMSCILSAVLLVISQPDQRYAFDTMNFLSNICQKIVVETGSASDQFEMIAAMSAFGINNQVQESEDED